MLIIFSASTDALSGSQTSRFLGPLVRWLIPGLSEEAVGDVVFAIRKAAHVTEYAILSGLLWHAIRKPRRDDPRPWKWSQAGWAVLAATLYAATDEYHQTLTNARFGSAVDVGIDAFGAVCGVLVIWALGKWFKKW